jgi:adenylate cyclase
MISNLIAPVSAGGSLEKLPARVRETIEAQQDESEILIGWVQLAVVIAFGVLYILAPKTFSEEAAFAPVPWALSLYLLFTIIRLMLAHARRLPHWFVYTSIVVDMSLLLGLIWSFHIQYEQPASFYLKVPTLLYVFIFIALRALRFEVRYVLISGLAAAFGWLSMVWYVISVDPNDPMITKDYVQYMTSNSVLLGAEFDKVISILMVTLILAAAIARGRNLLIRSVAEGVAARDLSKFVPSEVVKQVTSSEHGIRAGDGEVREATILFTDLEGFTTISEGLTPVQLITTLNEYFASVTEPIERNGGVNNQFQGDAILATFNLPERLENHAARAIKTALEIQSILENRRFGNGISLRSRVGINTGVVVGGLVGTGERLGYTVHGDEVNLAARLEQLNKDYGTRIIISARTRELAANETFQFDQMGEVRVRGRKMPVTIYTVMSA